MELLTKENFSSLPVVNADGYYQTMLHISDIANTYLRNRLLGFIYKIQYNFWKSYRGFEWKNYKLKLSKWGNFNKFKRGFRTG